MSTFLISFIFLFQIMPEFYFRANHLKEKVTEKENEIIKLKEQVETFKASCETHAANIRRLKKQFTLVSWVLVAN